MDAGIVEAYARSACSTAVMEADKLYVPMIGMATAPEIFVALNLSRDQMDRIHEVGRVVERWSRFLDASDVHVIANAKDPILRMVLQLRTPAARCRFRGQWRSAEGVQKWSFVRASRGARNTA